MELDGLKNAHIRDGAAVVQYLVWLDKQVIVGLMAFDFCIVLKNATLRSFRFPFFFSEIKQIKNHAVGR